MLQHPVACKAWHDLSSVQRIDDCCRCISSHYGALNDWSKLTRMSLPRHVGLQEECATLHTSLQSQYTAIRVLLTSAPAVQLSLSAARRSEAPQFELLSSPGFTAHRRSVIGGQRNDCHKSCRTHPNRTIDNRLDDLRTSATKTVAMDLILSLFSQRPAWAVRL